MTKEEQGKHDYEDGNQEMRDWFRCQWAVWPFVLNKRLKFSFRYHYGAWLAYKSLTNKKTLLSEEFIDSIEHQI